jgi:long-chain acyl-CoA synthetase
MTTLIDPLRRALQVGADRSAVICGDTELTYAQTWERCRRLIGGLRGLGVRDGDRVAIVGPNSHRYLECYQAIPGAGMVFVPLNARHTPSELRYALEDAGTKVLFAADADPTLADVVEHVIDLDAGYEALLADAQPADFPDSLDENTLAGLFYTGGTTGASKGVMLSHRNLVANAMHFSMCWRFTAETRFLIMAPLFHAAGSIAVLSTVWNAGCQVVLPAFDPVAALDLIAQHGATASLGVPTMIAALSEEQLARPRDVSSFVYLAHGGSPISSETLRRAHRAFPNAELLHIYGTTETAPIATLLPHEERELDTPRVRSCGQPAVGVEVAVLNVDGTRATRREVGEIAIKGENVMAGYWNKPEQTAAVLVDGWYRSGDLGYEDEDGYIYLVDRSKDMIVSGGENVYSTEVEEALYRHPAVLEAAVFGVPDEKWGEAVVAVVIPREPVEEDALVAHCRELIADYKVPKWIDVRDEPLPKSGAGKVLKRELREKYWSDANTHVSGA